MNTLATPDILASVAEASARQLQPVRDFLSAPPDSVAKALWRAREEFSGIVKKRNYDRPEDAFDYMPADDVVKAGSECFRKCDLLLLLSGPDVKLVGQIYVAHRFGAVQHRLTLDVWHLGPVCWPMPTRDGISQGMSLALTMSTARAYRETLCMWGVGGAKEDADAPKGSQSKPAGKKHTARQAGAWARANGQSVPKDETESDLREQLEEEKRIEAEKKADADPRFKDEQPMSDPPGLMDDELTVPPGSAETFDTKGKGEADSIGAQPLTEPPAPGVLPGAGSSNPDEKSSGVLPESGGCKAADDSSTPPSPGGVPIATEERPSGSAPPVAVVPPVSAAGPAPRSASNSGAGGETTSPLSSSSPPAPVVSLCRGCGEPIPDGHERVFGTAGGLEAEWHIGCDRVRVGDDLSEPLVQPTPSQVKAVDLLARRVAESRAGKWARSKEREARKAFLCSVCQPSVPDGGPPAEWEPAIRKGDKHRDGEKAGRCCLKCYERLMAEAEPVKEGA